MINPNICKLVLVTNIHVGHCVDGDYYGCTGEYRGVKIRISEFKPNKNKVRRLWLRYSILTDEYYLTQRQP